MLDCAQLVVGYDVVLGKSRIAKIAQFFHRRNIAGQSSPKAVIDHLPERLHHRHYSFSRRVWLLDAFDDGYCRQMCPYTYFVLKEWSTFGGGGVSRTVDRTT